MQGVPATRSKNKNKNLDLAAGTTYGVIRDEIERNEFFF